MLWDFYCAKCHETTEHWARRDEDLNCERCGTFLDRCPGGKKMLYFEEGRPRQHFALGEKPITSHGEHKKRMRDRGVVECNNELPPRMKAKGITPKKEAMREITSANKGRWF